MSTPKKFSELPLVSDIGDAKLLVVDDTGVKRAAKPAPYPQPRRTLPYATDDADTWYRIANINKSGLGLVFLCQVYSYASPRSVILAVAADGWGTNPQTGTDVRLVAGVPTYFKKARIVCDAWNTDNSAWLDVLVAKSRNSGSVYIFGVNINAVDSVTKNPSIDSALSVKEFDLTQSGGVICCTVVGPYRVTVTQKGGPHEQTGQSAERSSAYLSDAERHDRTRIVSGHGRVGSGNILRHVFDSKYSARFHGERNSGERVHEFEDRLATIDRKDISECGKDIYESLLAGLMGSLGSDKISLDHLTARKEVVVA